MSSKKKIIKILPFSAGILLIAVAIFNAVALITYDPYDPSFNLATDAVVKNLAGIGGAYIAEPILEFIGLCGILFVLIPLIWGVKFVKKLEIPYFWAKITILFFAIPSTAGFFTIFDYLLDVPEAWPSDSFGGSIGLYLQNNISQYITELGFALLAIIATILSVFFTAGLAASQWSKCAKMIFQISAKIVHYIKLAAYFILDRLLYIKRLIGKEGGASPAPKAQKNIVKSRRGKASKNKNSDEIGEIQPSFDIVMKDKYQIPPTDLLQVAPKKSKNALNEASLAQNAQLLEKVLEDFGIKGKITEVNPGPVVTLYSLEPSAGTKSARVIGLADDIARSMSAVSARIAVIPGQNAIGIELPNSTRETVYFRELISSGVFRKTEAKLPLALGKDISGDPIVIDLAKTPHLLVAGTTGSGKSVGINAMILSLLYKYSPDECKFIMVDPKMLELSVYQDIPHLITPVVTEPGKAIVALKWTVKEMENRYRLMSNLNVRNVGGYNDKIKAAKKKGEELTRSVQTGFDIETGKPIIETVALDMTPLPFIVVIVDEMADLMMVGGKEIEISVQRLAQMARAAGIHIILATQRPSVDVITGIIKANFPTRISFQVTSKIDSRTILGEQGAEQLLGMGDMLYMSGGSKITRVHGPFVGDEEVEHVVKFLKKQGKPSYIEDVTIDEDEEFTAGEAGANSSPKDALFDQAVEIVQRDGKASTSYVQRSLKIGYNRAANIIEQMEKDGIVSKADHVGRREVL